MEPDGNYDDINNINEESKYLFPNLDISPQGCVEFPYFHSPSQLLPYESFSKFESDLKYEENFLSIFNLNSEFPELSYPCQAQPQNLERVLQFTEPSADDLLLPESSSSYFQLLKDFRVAMQDEIPPEYQFDPVQLSTLALSRITKELKVLATGLPCEESGSVFCSFNSANLSIVQSLISGTEGSPYEHGLYLFNIRLEKDYPSRPPVMNIATTGHGKVRFSPNLYENGFVCLSIINTWSGDPEEMWNPTYSTLMQVFLSIQALVMDKKIIQKEPGFESYPEDHADNLIYSLIVKYGNMAYAMLENLKRPPKGFEEVVKQHFRIKKAKILKTCENWVNESQTLSASSSCCLLSSHNPTVLAEFARKGIYPAFAEVFAELRTELDKL